jgi:hypothetical protein
MFEGCDPECAVIADRDQPAAVWRQPEPGEAAEATVAGAESKARLEGERSEFRGG